MLPSVLAGPCFMHSYFPQNVSTEKKLCEKWAMKNGRDNYNGNGNNGHGIWGQSYKTSYTLGKIYKFVLILDNML